MHIGYIAIIIALLGGLWFVSDQKGDLETERDLLVSDREALVDELTQTQEEYASTTETLGTLIATLEGDLEATLGENAKKDQEISDTITVLQGVQTNLERSQEVRTQLEEELTEEKAKIGILSDTVSSINSVVGDLNKLATTDEELLQKYSKVYFLNEHYIPENLVQVEDEYKYNIERRYWFHRDAYPHLKQMMDDAKADDVELLVISAYRSFWTQSALKDAYTVQYGEGANTFSADQGYSEHQLGTAVDFTNREIGGFDGFEGTLEYFWLLSNGYKYGFVLSYPPNNAYYIFEPWHWRFVGVELATHLRDNGKFFYDEEQRIIDGFLINIFDPVEE